MPGAGRPAFEPTDHERKQVEAMSGYGLPIEQIAVLVRDGIDTDTLRKHFAQELISGKAKANAQVGKTLFQKVMAGNNQPCQPPLPPMMRGRGKRSGFGRTFQQSSVSQTGSERFSVMASS